MARRGDLLLLAVLLVVGAAVLSRDLGTASFWGDEAIYAQVARESAAGPWLPLRFNGEVYLSKPPLRILLTAFLFRCFGESELVARLPDVLMTLGLLALLFWQGRRWFGSATALAGGLILLGSGKFLFQHGMRDAVQEAAVVLLGTLMLLLWLRHLEDGVEGGLGGGGRGRVAVVAACAALLALVKNPLGLLLAFVLVGVGGVEAVVAGRREALTRGTWLVPVVALAGFAAWVAAMDLAIGGRYLAFLHRDIVVRGTSGVDPVHLRSTFYYAHSLVDDFGGWALLAVPAAWGAVRRLGQRHRRPMEDRVRLLLAGWSGLLVLAFSLAVSKNPWYIYPAYPAIALFLASGIPVLLGWAGRPGARGRRWAGVALAVLLAVEAGTAWVAAGRDDRVLEVDAFGGQYRALPEARLVIAVDELRRHGDFRAWNHFYLTGLPGAEMGPVAPEPLPRGRCTYAAVPDPHPYLAAGWLWWRPLERIDRREAPLHLVGTCVPPSPPPH